MICSIQTYQQTGFTLLELVLVLFILAILTTTSLSLIETEDGQIRYEASINKRDAVIDALYNETLEGNQRILSGYIVDNGRLPPIDAINDDSDERMNYWLFENSLETYASVNAYSDTDGTPELLTDGTNNYPMYKGFRAGGYLRADNRSGNPSTNDEFNDEWGANLFISDIGEPNANDIIIGFDGDGGIDFDLDTTDDETQLIKPSPFNVDNDITFSEADWTIHRDQLHIIFTTNDSACAGACDYTISVSVFRNTTTCGTTASDCWDTYYFTLSGMSDGDSHDTLIDTETWNFNGNGSSTRIPVGEHLAVVLDAAGDATTLTSARFKVLPNSTQPIVTLTVN